MGEYKEAVSFVAVLIAGGSLLLAYIGWRRTRNKDTKQDANQLSRIEFTLDNVSNTVNEIKGDMRAVRVDVTDLQTRMTKMEYKHELEEKEDHHER